MHYWLFSKDVKMLYGVIQDNASHRDASQGISHVYPSVGKLSGEIHNTNFLTSLMFMFSLKTETTTKLHINLHIMRILAILYLKGLKYRIFFLNL